MLLLRDYYPAPDARFAARVQAVLAASEHKQDGVANVGYSPHGAQII